MESWEARSGPVDTAGGAGEQRAGDTDLGAFGDGTFGVWEVTPGTSTDVEVDEVAVVLCGRGAVEDLDSGAVVGLVPGTVLRLTAGQRTRWTVSETLRKVYVVR